ncbi:uncharacterized protein VTP21DRAFT_1076 [Calcarisporiella thermophila]|uniref:uncharacterized protein n=1 Tax=Calcarisporiella thermophila TaxID=911321 RepID=UPI0037444E8E
MSCPASSRYKITQLPTASGTEPRKDAMSKVNGEISDLIDNYSSDRVYTIEQFEKINDWLETHDIVIDGIPISHFELDSKGRLIPMSQSPISKEAVVAEIIRQLTRWNIYSQQNGIVTGSQGGFNFAVLEGREIRAPDVAFTPKEIYRALDEQQLDTFRGQPFHPTFVVEVEDVSSSSKLAELTEKFKEIYFNAGVDLGWLINPANKKIYIFEKTLNGSVRRYSHEWKNVSGGNVLPRFVLKIRLVEDVISQESSEPGSSSQENLEIHCPECTEIFSDRLDFIDHYEEEHARKWHKG